MGKDDHNAQLPQELLSMVCRGFCVLALIILSGFWRLQIVETEKYVEMAERNRSRIMPIVATHSRILGREQRVLVAPDRRPDSGWRRPNPAGIVRTCQYTAGIRGCGDRRKVRHEPLRKTA